VKSKVKVCHLNGLMKSFASMLINFIVGVDSAPEGFEGRNQVGSKLPKSLQRIS
jgi:hypothetical protein